jgi:thiamine-phosphate pyrophosphorylase
MFIVNDRTDIAVLVRAHGVHLGQQDLPPSDARKLLPSPAIIGSSTHNEQQLMAALSLPIDYIAVGPIFHTSTKEDADAVVGLELVSYVPRAGRLPLVAVGGINIDNLASVLRAGADAVAMVSGLFTGCRSIEAISARAKEALERAISVGRQVPDVP